MTQTETAAREPIHNLFSREIQPIKSWPHWLERWQAATTVEEMIGLLHVGFSYPVYSNSPEAEHEYAKVDPVLFYMMIANGWNTPGAFNVRNDPDSSSDQRCKVARKAFDRLCVHYFKLEKRGTYSERRYSWDREVFDDARFAAIQWFFDARFAPANTWRRIRNVPSASDMMNNGKHAREFLLEVAGIIWNWTPRKGTHPTERYSPEIKARIAAENKVMEAKMLAARPWAIGVLAYFEELRKLEERVGNFDSASLEVLRGLALGQWLRYTATGVSDRRVETIEEACLAGSEAAWLLKRHELIVSENARLLGKGAPS